MRPIMKGIYTGILCLIGIASAKGGESISATNPLKVQVTTSDNSVANATPENLKSTKKLRNVASATTLLDSSPTKSKSTSGEYPNEISSNNTSVSIFTSKSSEAIENHFNHSLSSIGYDTTLSSIVSGSSSQQTKLDTNTIIISTDKLIDFTETTLIDAGNSKRITAISTMKSISRHSDSVTNSETNSMVATLSINNTPVDLTANSSVASIGILTGIMTSYKSTEHLPTTSSEIPWDKSSSDFPSESPEEITSALPRTSSESSDEISMMSPRSTMALPATSSKSSEDITTTSLLNSSTSPLPSESPESITTTSSNAPMDVSISPLLGTPEEKKKSSSQVTITYSSSVGGPTSNIDSEILLPTFATAGNRALKLAVSITFLVIAVVATAVLLVYMIRIKRRSVLYEELRLLP